jgi:hypothetical protein
LKALRQSILMFDKILDVIPREGVESGNQVDAVTGDGM